MLNSGDRILTTHVGSLPRPQALIDAFVAEDRGVALDRAAREAALREALVSETDAEVRGEIAEALQPSFP